MSECAGSQAVQCEKVARNRQNKEETKTISQPVRRITIISACPIVSKNGNANCNTQQATNNGNAALRTITHRRTIRKGVIKVSRGTRRPDAGSNPVSVTRSIMLTRFRHLVPPSARAHGGSGAEPIRSLKQMSRVDTSGNKTASNAITSVHMLTVPSSCDKPKPCKKKAIPTCLTRRRDKPKPCKKKAIRTCVTRRRDKPKPCKKKVIPTCVTRRRDKPKPCKKRTFPGVKSIIITSNQKKMSPRVTSKITIIDRRQGQVASGSCGTMSNAAAQSTAPASSMAKTKPCKKKAIRTCLARRRDKPKPCTKKAIRTCLTRRRDKPKPCTKKTIRTCVTRRRDKPKPCKKRTFPRVKSIIITSNHKIMLNAAAQSTASASPMAKPKPCKKKAVRTCLTRRRRVRQNVCRQNRIIRNTPRDSIMQKKVAGISTEARRRVCAAAEREKDMLACEKLAEAKRCIDGAARAAMERHEKKIKELCLKQEEIMEKERETNLRSLVEAKLCIIEDKFRENLKYVEEKAEFEQKDIEAEARRELAELELAENLDKAYERDCAKRCK